MHYSHCSHCCQCCHCCHFSHYSHYFHYSHYSLTTPTAATTPTTPTAPTAPTTPTLLPLLPHYSHCCHYFHDPHYLLHKCHVALVQHVAHVQQPVPEKRVEFSNRVAGAFVQSLTPQKMATPRLLPARWWFGAPHVGLRGTPCCPPTVPARWKVQTPTKAPWFRVAPAAHCGNSEWE